MKEKQQFRILFREFLFNIVDLELLSAHALGDMSKLLGQFAGLLLWLSSMMLLGGLMTRADPRPGAFWGTEHSFIALTMLIVGLFAIVSWDSALPSRRDVLVLAPLPIRLRTLFAAKVAALISALSLTVLSIHIFGFLGWTPHFTPADSGFTGWFRTVAAYWMSMYGAGAFVFCSLLGLQGMAGQLPRRYFLRLSAFLQMAALCALLGGFFMEPRLGSPAALAWAPAYWFFALFHQVAGDLPAGMAAAAGRAWIALAVSATTAGVAFLLSYFRTVRKIVEEPDIIPTVRALSWLPRFGGQLDTAVTQFSIRTLLRSRQHRMILAFFAGIGFAVVTVGMREDRGHTPNVGWMIASAILMAACVVGCRVVFAMPIDLRANWIFRMTQLQPTVRYLTACRRPLFVMAVAPVWLLSAAAFFSIWPWQMAVRHLAVLALWGTILAYACLYRFQKIPFTCSYLPGKSQIHLMIIAAVGLLLLTTVGVVYEFGTFTKPREYEALVAVMSIIAGVAHWLVVNEANSEDAEVRFEEIVAPAVLELHLQKDGFLTSH